MRQVIYYTKHKNRQVVVYPSFEMFPKKQRMENLEKGAKTKAKFKGEMSKNTRKKITRIIEVWTTAIELTFANQNKPISKLSECMTFVTLTLSAIQFHTDKEIKRSILNPFLLAAARSWGLKNSLWVAETQKNGNIHFHMLFDRYVKHNELREVWNNAQEHLGYISAYTSQFIGLTEAEYVKKESNGSKNSKKSLIKRYQSGCADGWENPNSTDIKALRGINNVAAYLVKYMTKSISRRLIEGRLWSCTRALGSIDYYTSIMSNELYEWLNALMDKGDSREYHQEYFSVYTTPMNAKNPMKSSPEFKELEKHYLSIYDLIYKEKPPKKEPEPPTALTPKQGRDTVTDRQLRLYPKQD